MLRFWNFVSNLGLDKITDPGEARQVMLLNRIITIGNVNLLCLIPVGLYFDEPIVVASILVGLIPGIVSLVLSHKGYFNTARVLFLCSAILYVAGLSILNGKDAGSHVTFILLTTLHLVFFRKSKWSLAAFGAIVVIFAGVVWWIETHDSHFDHLSAGVKRAAFYINILSNMFLVYFVVLYFKKAAQEYEEVILKKNEEISEKNKNITDSIIYARRIQRSLLPTDKYIEKSLEKRDKEEKIKSS
jgi:phosphoserine phosphatase RsbU/P